MIFEIVSRVEAADKGPVNELVVNPDALAQAQNTKKEAKDLFKKMADSLVQISKPAREMALKEFDAIIWGFGAKPEKSNEAVERTRIELNQIFNETFAEYEGVERAYSGLIVDIKDLNLTSDNQVYYNRENGKVVIQLLEMSRAAAGAYENETGTPVKRIRKAIEARMMEIFEGKINEFVNRKVTGIIDRVKKGQPEPSAPRQSEPSAPTQAPAGASEGGQGLMEKKIEEAQEAIANRKRLLDETTRGQ